MAFDENLLARDLERHEAKRFKTYKCSAGKNTIAIGRNLDDVGLSAAELKAIGASLHDIIAGKVTLTDDQCMMLYRNDIARVRADLDRGAPWWRDLPEPAARALANMAFNMGWPRLSGFKNMLAALKNSDYETAAEEALNSKWRDQVKGRADDVAALFRSCAA